MESIDNNTNILRFKKPKFGTLEVFFGSFIFFMFVYFIKEFGSSLTLENSINNPTTSLFWILCVIIILMGWLIAYYTARLEKIEYTFFSFINLLQFHQIFDKNICDTSNISRDIKCINRYSKLCKHIDDTNLYSTEKSTNVNFSEQDKESVKTDTHNIRKSRNFSEL
jgi:hypothetical protein